MSNTKTTLESADHTSLRYMIITDWHNANRMEDEWLWSELTSILVGYKTAILFYDISAALEEEIEFLSNLAMMRKHMSEG